MNEKSGTTDSIYNQITSGDVDFTKATVHYTSEPDNYIECHGCSGKGWIENTKGEIKLCPVCEGKGKLNKEKDCVEREKRDNLPWYPWCPCYPWPSRIDDPYWPTYPIVTNYNVKTDDCTNCCNQK